MIGGLEMDQLAKIKVIGLGTGTCSRHQRELTTAIKRARNIALLPFSGD